MASETFDLTLASSSFSREVRATRKKEEEEKKNDDREQVGQVKEGMR